MSFVRGCRMRGWHSKISGGSRAGALGAWPSLFLDQTEARTAEKNFLETAPAPPYLRVWMTGAPPYLKVFIRHWKWWEVGKFGAPESQGRMPREAVHVDYSSTLYQKPLMNVCLWGHLIDAYLVSLFIYVYIYEYHLKNYGDRGHPSKSP